ncbi:hypothetical protein B484DRAFT_429592 [Ochromonadaceae sp. CCMP2298]|nr:hypothetical protein B484DRAFT_429592 [Ochromonadaceae sp. CCMP2298]
MSDEGAAMVFPGAAAVASTAATGGDLAGGPPILTHEQTIWPEVNPDCMITTMRALNTQQPTQCGKIAAGYKPWSQMLDAQKTKVYVIWGKLNAGLQHACINNATTLTVRIAGTQAAIAASAVDGAGRCPNTTKCDLARMLMLRKEPSAIVLWSSLEHSLSRDQLDARRSQSAPSGSSSSSSGALVVGNLGDVANPYNALTAMFNDWTGFLPQNPMIRYHFINHKSVPIVPYVSADPDTTALAAFCHDINPSDPSHASIMRDPDWFKEQWLKLRSTLVKVYADFHRSGKMTPHGEAEVEWYSDREVQRWVYHSGAKNRTFADVSRYSYAIMEAADFQGLGKNQPEGAGRDNSIAGEEEGNSAAANDRRKTNKGQSRSKNSGDNIGRSIRESAADEAQLETLKFLFKEGTPGTKATAMAQLKNYSKKRSFSPDPVPVARSARGASRGAQPSARGSRHDRHVRHCDQTESDFEREMQGARDCHGNQENEGRDNDGSDDDQDDDGL